MAFKTQLKYKGKSYVLAQFILCKINWGFLTTFASQWVVPFLVFWLGYIYLRDLRHQTNYSDFCCHTCISQCNQNALSCCCQVRNALLKNRFNFPLI